MNSQWKSIQHRCRGRQIVIFGASEIGERTARRLGYPNVLALDTSPSMWGSSYGSLVAIQNPDLFLRSNNPKNFYFVICTTSFDQVATLLESFGLMESEDYSVSPVVGNLAPMVELEEFAGKFLIASGGPASVDPEFGGGLYELQVKRDERQLRKVMKGSFHGIRSFRDGYLLTEDERGLVYIDSSYKILHEVPLAVGCRPHGLAVSDSNDEVFIVGSHSECVFVVDGNLKIDRTLHFSGQSTRFGAAAHHINDICMSDDRLLVSMFSISGHWRIGNYDGGVVEVDSENGGLVGVLVNNLQLPHSVSIVETELFVLDSLNGRILNGVNHLVSQVPAFLRGLVVRENHYIVGGSRNRNLRQYRNSVQPVSIDSCVYVICKKEPIFRTISLDNRIPEIHCIIEIPD